MTLHPEQDNRRILELDRQLLDPTRHAFHENRDWYRDLIEHSQDLLCVHDLEGRLLSVNGPPARLLGYSVEEILQIPMRELIAPEYRQDFESYLERLKSTGEARGLLVAVARSGERRIWEYSNTLRSDGRGNPIVSGIARDVTEQKRAEKLAREANELNRQIISSASEGVVVYDRNLRCVAWNPFMEKMTGIAGSQAIGRLYGELIPPELMGHEPEAELKRALQGQTITVPDEKLRFQKAARNGSRAAKVRCAMLREELPGSSLLCRT